MTDSSPETRLSLEETTPLTEVLESTAERIREALDVLTPKAERLVSDATRAQNPDTSVTTTVANLADFWGAWMDQAALGAERLASNLTLLTHDTIPPVEWLSQTPIDVPAVAHNCIFRVTGLTSSEGRLITNREVTVVRPDLTPFTPFNPAVPSEWPGQVYLRIRTFGWVPTGPVAGQLVPVHPSLLQPVGDSIPIYCALG